MTQLGILKERGGECHLLTVITRSLHYVQEMKACRASHNYLSVRMFQLENHWSDLDKI
jgi:hypothetical protein